MFVSSVMTGFEAERAAVRSAIESLDLRPLMAELAPASADPSKTALLAQVESADVVVLILGARYGFLGADGRSPTEDEFNHALQLGRPVLVFVQTGVTREPKQEAFVARVQGSWEDGAFTAFFSDATELGYAVVKALNNLRSEQLGGGAAPAAQRRVIELVSERNRRDTPRGRALRVGLVPVGTGRLLDAVTLGDATLGERAAAVLRDHDLVPQAAGIDVSISSAGLSLQAASPSAGALATVRLQPDGAVAVEVSVSADGSMGSMAISEPRVVAAVASASLVAGDLWKLLRNGDRIRQVALAVAILDAQYAAWSRSGQVGGSMTMSTLPSLAGAPEEPLLVRRAELGGDQLVHSLVAELRQVFAYADGVLD